MSDTINTGKSFTVGTGAVMMTDIISPLLDKDGFPTFSAQVGEKVYIASLEPLTVCKAEATNFLIPVMPEDFQTVKGRPRRF